MFIALYLLVGFIFIGSVVLINLDSPESFIQEYDDYLHLSVPKTFLESGDWSTLNVGPYSSMDNFSHPLQSGYYPASWHMLVAFVSSVTSCESIALCANVVNFFFMSVLFSLSSLMFLKRVFRDNSTSLIIGSVASYSFTALPYYGLTHGLHPNLTAVLLVPAGLSAVMKLYETLRNRKSDLLGMAICALLIIMAIGFMHPSAFFTLIIGSAIFLIWQLILDDGLPGKIKAIGCIISILTFIGLWIIVFNLPQIQSMASFAKTSESNLAMGVFHVFSFEFIYETPQYIIGFIVIIGIIKAVIRKEYGWILCSFLLFALCFYTTITLGSENLLKRFFGAFWYCSSCRLTWNVVIFAIPLLVIGGNSLTETLLKVLVRIAPAESKKIKYISSWVFTAFLILLALLPTVSLNSSKNSVFPFANLELELRKQYELPEEIKYDNDEREFVKRVKEIIGDDEVVFNLPFDGSYLAFGMDGLRTYFRSFGGSMSKNAWLIAQNLNDYVNDSDVRKAVEASKCKYIILLDADKSAETMDMPFNESKWSGISSINENTEGFKLILTDGDMQLYEILNN